MREAEVHVAFDGREWCVLEARTDLGRFPTRQSAIQAAARAARQSRAAGVYARVIVRLNPPTERLAS
jgi:hypothetical protein